MKHKGFSMLAAKWMMVALAAAIVYFISNRTLGSYNADTINLQVRLKSQSDFTMQVFFDTGMGLNEGQSAVKSVRKNERTQVVQFLLPRPNLKKVRIDFGDIQGVIDVEEIALKELWTKEDLFPLLNQTNQLVIDRGEKIVLTSTGNDPFVVSDDLPKFIEQFDASQKAATKRAPVIITIVIIGLLILIFRHSLASFEKEIRFERIVAAFFLVVLYIPFINGTFSLELDDTRNTEKRRLAEKPVFEWGAITSYPSNFELYFNDHFSFRKTFVGINTSLSVRLATSSPRVSIGDDGWLYYADKNDGDSNTDHQQLIHLDENRLEAIRSNLERKQKYFDSLGVQFLVVIPPDKQSVYPEYLPAAVNVRGKNGKRLDQVLDYLKSKNSTVKILDLRPVLLEHKNDSLAIYMKTDTHWTDYGAYLSYRKIAESLGVAPVGIDNFRIDKSSERPGDLADLIAANDQYSESNRVEMTPIAPAPFNQVELDRNYYPGKIYYANPLKVINPANPNLPKALIFRDSFASSLLKFLPYHFSDTMCVLICELDRDIVEKEKPQIVIMEILERYAMCLERE